MSHCSALLSSSLSVWVFVLLVMPDSEWTFVYFVLLSPSSAHFSASSLFSTFASNSCFLHLPFHPRCIYYNSHNYLLHLLLLPPLPHLLHPHHHHQYLLCVTVCMRLFRPSPVLLLPNASLIPSRSHHQWPLHNISLSLTLSTWLENALVRDRKHGVSEEGCLWMKNEKMNERRKKKQMLT